jgi:hypothetical protein
MDIDYDGLALPAEKTHPKDFPAQQDDRVTLFEVKAPRETQGNLPVSAVVL